MESSAESHPMSGSALSYVELDALSAMESVLSRTSGDYYNDCGNAKHGIGAVNYEKNSHCRVLAV